MKKAKFLVLSHGRVATASLLEGFQYVSNLFVPSYWHSDGALLSGNLNYFFEYEGRYSSQINFPIEMPGIYLGLISHNFPIQKLEFEKIAAQANSFLELDASVFVYDRNFRDNILSSYKAYVTTWFCLRHSNKKLVAPDSFNTINPLGFKDFVLKYAVIADAAFQADTYKKIGYNVHKRRFEDLCDMDCEIKNILRLSDIDISSNLIIPKVEYKSMDNWPIQTSFAFHNKFIIGGRPLSVGFFSPYRRHPNQGTLTYKIHENVYVGMDQWFLIPEKYKEAIMSCTDPWGVVVNTREKYRLYESAVLNSVNEFYYAEVASQSMV